MSRGVRDPPADTRQSNIKTVKHIRDSRETSAHIRQSRPGSGLGFQVKVLKTFEVAPSSLGCAARWTQVEAASFFFFITLKPRAE